MFTRTLGILQILSIDIVFGAVILLHFFCAYMGVMPAKEIYFLLGFSVWVIYTIDHLRDAQKAPQANRERYRFHLRYEKQLRIAIFMVVASCMGLLFFLELTILIGGATLVLFSGIYLIIQKRLARLGLKELYVALIYSSGILLTPFILSNTFPYPAFILLFVLTYINLILFSLFEKEEDLKDQFTSIATIVDSRALEMLVLVLLALGISTGILLRFDVLSCYFLIAFVTYLILFFKASRFKERELYRVIGDGIFLLPIFFG